MSDFATLIHGDLSDVLRVLDEGECQAHELCAVLYNTIRTVITLQQQVTSLRAELAASRHELVGAKKSARAQARIIKSLQQQRAHLNAQRDQWIEARNTLESERAANARLTDELAASREREARMRALIADDGHAMTFQSLGQYRTALLRALAEGAQG